MSEITLTNANFETEVLKSKLPVLVDFWAVWCGPCKMVAPAVAKLADNHAGKLKVGKVNVDEQPDLAEKYHISSIPTLAIFKDGKVVNQRIGAVSLAVLESFVAEYV
ncbi:MAG: thioredoxin [Sphaerochaetaceae bacterium]|jgi:thioredoxin 1|nr:thioredoxin [Sphaerochaetaceae bacterium]MDD3941409.1 thioredoxin [Sphaerochaetaceae bacterium]MDX9939652.1 thioredoxin [Sphaerochaetaceae bacterium]